MNVILRIDLYSHKILSVVHVRELNLREQLRDVTDKRDLGQHALAREGKKGDSRAARVSGTAQGCLPCWLSPACLRFQVARRTLLGGSVAP